MIGGFATVMTVRIPSNERIHSAETRRRMNGQKTGRLNS
jgi:hypothetical protein